jgi:SSS family transporter
MPAHLHAFDLAIVALYLIAITLFGLRVARAHRTQDRSLRGYFLANRSAPWWAIALSIVSAETSTLTIIGTPALAFAGDFGFLQIVLGYMLGRIVVAALFLPKYFQGEMLTAYQLIDRRFGHTLHKVTAALFLLTRAAAEGVRVFAVSIVVAIAIGSGDILSIAIISALTLLYTFEGGMAAVIWTDVVQMAIYLAGTLVAIATLGHHVPGGWHHIHAVAAAAGKFHMLNFALNLTTTYTFWAGVLGGTFLTMASHGTDQLMVQRMLAAKNLTESRLALLSSGVVIFIQFALFLLIGAGLFVFYELHPSSLTSFTTSNPNRIFPAFIVAEMPPGIAGLLVAAILAAAMSNLSAALNSLSSTTVVDFYMGWRPSANDRERLIVSHASTVLWALVLFAVAVYSVRAGGKGNVVEIGLSIASVAYGCLLGVFLLGTLTRYATQWGAIIGMVTGFALNLALWQFPGRILFSGFLNTPTVAEGWTHPTVIAIPRIAWTWYVLIGALTTFAIGSLASLLFRKQSRRAIPATIALTLLAVILSGASRPCDAQSKDPDAFNPPPTAHTVPTTTPDFTPVSTAINTAIAQKKLPGAVVLIGHNGHIAFEQAYGFRKLAGEPGLDGKPSPAEPMTEDTIFDMASLTKCLATATAIMQLYEAHKLAFDDPVAKYLPEFAPLNAPAGKQNVTIRELLTHYSGLPPDIDLKDPWGLAAPDKAEGIRRAMASPLTTTPGTHFEYSDVNYIVLGALVEKLSGQPLDVYALQHIFTPLKMMHTRYLPYDAACGADKLGAAIVGDHETRSCPSGTWYAWGYRENIAPTQHDDQGTPATNPNFDHLLRGTVHDPTTRRMGGVAGHAGVFSTAADLSLFAQALLDRLAGRPSDFPLTRASLQLMTTPEQPATALPGATIFTQDGQPTTGIAQRGFGWDINSAFSRPRGSIFPTTVYGQPDATIFTPNPGPIFPTIVPGQPAHPAVPSFGHTGFTGTSLWLDPDSDTYVILLANSVHPRGNPSISPLRGEVATAAALAFGTCLVLMNDCDNRNSPGPPPYLDTIPSPLTAAISDDNPNPQPTLTGIDVLESTHFAALAEAAARHNNHLRIGLLTNQTGLDSRGHRTIDILAHSLPRSSRIKLALTTLFSPEHGIFGLKDSTTIAPETDPGTHLPVISLYGPKDSDKHPSPDQLKDLDAIVIDLQDAGVRFYTYETVVGYFLEAAACETARAHPLEVILLDRPNPINGDAVQGPISNAAPSYIDYMPLPIRHGLTLGELAQYIHGEQPVTCAPSTTPIQNSAKLTVVPMQNWHRSQFFDQTKLPWTNPSPNLRSPTESILYPALGLLDFTNISVGRGTTTPFELFGADATPATKTKPTQPTWFNAQEVATYLTARKIPGVTFTPTTTPIADDANRYPYHGQTIPTVRLTLTDRNALDSPELGIEIVSALHHLYPTHFTLDKTVPLIANAETSAALARGDDPHTIAASWASAIATFRTRREPYLLYH